MEIIKSGKNPYKIGFRCICGCEFVIKDEELGFISGFGDRYIHCPECKNGINEYHSTGPIYGNLSNEEIEKLIAQIDYTKWL